MEWEIEYTDEFGEWWDYLDADTQEDIAVVVNLLEARGVYLGFPYSSDVKNSKYAIRELRVQSGGQPYRILYAFDPRKAAILLIGGRKTDNKRWYEKYVAIAEKLYKEHLADLNKENKDG